MKERFFKFMLQARTSDDGRLLNRIVTVRNHKYPDQNEPCASCGHPYHRHDERVSLSSHTGCSECDVDDPKRCKQFRPKVGWSTFTRWRDRMEKEEYKVDGNPVKQK